MRLSSEFSTNTTFTELPEATSYNEDCSLQIPTFIEEPEEKSFLTQIREIANSDKPCDIKLQNYMEKCGFVLGATFDEPEGLMWAILKSIYPNATTKELLLELIDCQKAIPSLIEANWSAIESWLNGLDEKEAPALDVKDQATDLEKTLETQSLAPDEVTTWDAEEEATDLEKRPKGLECALKLLENGFWDINVALLAMIHHLNKKPIFAQTHDIQVHLFERLDLRDEKLECNAQGVPQSNRIVWSQPLGQGRNEKKCYILALEDPPGYQVLIPKHTEKDQMLAQTGKKSVSFSEDVTVFNYKNTPDQERENLPPKGNGQDGNGSEVKRSPKLARRLFSNPTQEQSEQAKKCNEGNEPRAKKQRTALKTVCVNASLDSLIN